MNRLIALDIETYDPNLHELGDGSFIVLLCKGSTSAFDAESTGSNPVSYS